VSSQTKNIHFAYTPILVDINKQNSHAHARLGDIL
jgi:hypothetical protein